MNLENIQKSFPLYPIEIGIARSREEKREIYRLRYHIYAEEIPYKLVSADHKNKLLYDQLDDWCTLFYAKVQSKIIGTIRVNIGEFAAFSPEIIHIYRMDRFETFYKENESHNYGLISKCMVAPVYRNLPLAIFTSLMKKAFELYCDNQVHFGFLNCNLYLLALYEHYGHQRIGRNIVDPNFGLASSLVIMPEDIEHLRKVHSPFFNIALDKGKTQNNHAVEWFHSEFLKSNNNINSQLVSVEKFWAILQARLNSLPNQIIPILHGLTEAEAKNFLHSCGIIVQCSKGDCIVTGEDVSQELNILLSGALRSSSINNIFPGQHFGEIGLVNRTKQISNITAVTDAEILVLSFHYFQKFRCLYPKIANKVLYNLTGIHDKEEKDHIVG